jgi:hypothetical protein
LPYALIQFAQRNRLPHKDVGVVQVCVPVGIAGHQDGLDPWKEPPHRGIVLHKLNASSALLAAIISYPREDKYSSIALRTLIHLLQAERSLSPARQTAAAILQPHLAEAPAPRVVQSQVATPNSAI